MEQKFAGNEIWSKKSQEQIDSENALNFPDSPGKEQNLRNIFDECYVSIHDDLGRLVHASPAMPQSNLISGTETPFRKMTDNFEFHNSDMSLSASTLKQRFTSSFL